MKTCRTCQKEKELTEFHHRTRYGTTKPLCDCIECIHEKSKYYSKINKEKRKIYTKEWREKNKDILKQKRSEKKDYYSQKNKEFRLKQGIEYKAIKKIADKKSYEKHKEKRLAECKKYAIENKEIVKQRAKAYRERNKEKLKIIAQEYRKNNREKTNKRKRNYTTNRRKTEPLYRLQGNLRKRTWEAFKNKDIPKNGVTEAILGASYPIIKRHIERQFTKGMTWDNYGKWHVDHKIPLASAKNEEDLRHLCHYTNLQPLWEKDNLAKKDIVTPTQMTIPI